MSKSALQPPEVRVEFVRPPPDESPLRSDIAGFIGATRRGPIGLPVRVEGLRDYRRVFGDLDGDHDTTYAIRGYFENGGVDAWVIRLAPDETPLARATWDITRPPAPGQTPQPWLAGMPARIDFAASSPGAWASGLVLTITFRREGARGRPEVDIFVRDPNGPGESLLGLDAWSLDEELAARSSLIRCSEVVPVLPMILGPRAARFELGFAIANVPLRSLDMTDYVRGLERLGDVPEVALVVMPELHALPEADAIAVTQLAIDQAEALRDRLVLVDLPRPATRIGHAGALAESVKTWLESRLEQDRVDIPWRAAASYFPWIRVDDPLDRARRIRTIPPSGHVAGIISLLDRERGAHHTPAVEPMIGVVDLEIDVGRDDHAVLNEQGVNVLRCVPGRGFAIWGGRTLERDRQQRYVAHRRLIHRIVRAIRNVAEPLVFETNGPELWLQLVRGITSVLLEAWRSGALKGQRAEEAFRVQCDAETNPPEEIELGRCLCRVSVAPAAPMEFITLRLALGRDGALEVLP